MRKKCVKYILHTAPGRGTFFLHTIVFYILCTHAPVLPQSDARVAKKTAKVCKTVFFHTHAFCRRVTHIILHMQDQRVLFHTRLPGDGPEPGPGPGPGDEHGPALGLRWCGDMSHYLLFADYLLTICPLFAYFLPTIYALFHYLSHLLTI